MRHYVSCPDKVCGAGWGMRCNNIYAFRPSEMIMSHQKLSLKSTNLLYRNRKAFIAIAPPSTIQTASVNSPIQQAIKNYTSIYRYMSTLSHTIHKTINRIQKWHNVKMRFTGFSNVNRFIVLWSL